MAPPLDPCSPVSHRLTVSKIVYRELSLQLGQDGEHAEHGSAFGSGGIDSLLEIDDHGNDRIEWRWATVPPATVPLPPAVGALAYARCTLGTTQASLSNAMCPWLGE